MSYEITGVLQKKGEIKQVKESFKVRTFAIETGGDYPQLIEFQLTQDRCESISGMGKGQELKVYFDIRGRAWNEKVITNLNAWKVEALDGTSTTTVQQASQVTKPAPQAAMADDDLPF